MSFCTTGTCPHGRGVFVWLGDGPWFGDRADPDYGRYPWVHDTSAPAEPGHLRVCERMPFANPEEAGEVCACGHHRHEATGPVPSSPHVAARRRACTECGCPDFRHRAEDTERRRTVPAEHPGVPVAMPAPHGGTRAAMPAETVQLALFGGAW